VAVDVAGADRFAKGDDSIADGVAHQHDAGHAQRAFEYKQQVRPRHRTTGRERDGPLHSWIDGVSDAKDVAKDDLRDIRYRRVLEIEIVATTAASTVGGRSRPCAFELGDVAAIINGVATAVGRVVVRFARLRKARQQVDGAYPIHHIGRSRFFRGAHHRAAAAQDHRYHGNRDSKGRPVDWAASTQHVTNPCQGTLLLTPAKGLYKGVQCDAAAGEKMWPQYSTVRRADVATELHS